MCDPLLIVSTALTAGGQLYGARNQRKALEGEAEGMRVQAGQLDELAEREQRSAYLEAAQVRDEAAQQARLIRQAAEDVRGATKAAYAGSGVRVGEGSAAVVDEALVRDSEQDAAMTILTGERRGGAIQTGADLQAWSQHAEAENLRRGAGNAQRAARQATRAGWLNAGGTVLQAAMEYSRWNTRMQQPRR